MAYTEEEMGKLILKAREIATAMSIFASMEPVMKAYIASCAHVKDHEVWKEAAARERGDIEAKTAELEKRRQAAAASAGREEGAKREREAKAEAEFAHFVQGIEAKKRTLDSEISAKQAQLNGILSEISQREHDLNDLRRQFNQFAQDHGLSLR